MSCNCGKPNCGCANLPKVVEIPGEDIQTLFHKVVIPASIGDETTFPPLPGRYYNVFAVYESSGEGYLYSSDGIPTKITDKSELKRLETLLGNEVAERKEADAYLEEKIDNIKGLKYEIVETLPETGEAGIIYLVPKTSEAPDFYDEYLWVNGAFEKIGSTEVDLNGYVKKEEIFNLSSDGSKDGVEITPARFSNPASAHNGGVAIGAATSATSSESTAVGYNASAYNSGRNAFGSRAAAYNGGYDAFGESSYAQSSARAYAGGNAQSSSLAIGPGAESNGMFSIAIDGYRNAVSGHTAEESKAIAKNGGLAIGYGAEADNIRDGNDPNTAMAIGHNAKSKDGGYEAIGADSSATNDSRAYAGGTASDGSIAFGGTATSAGRSVFGTASYNSYAFGGTATASGNQPGTSLRGNATGGLAIIGTANGAKSVAIGYDTSCTESGVEAIGNSSTAKGGGRAYAGATATEGGLAFGMSATSEQGGFEAIGRNSYATSGGRAYAGGKSFNGSIAIGGTAVGGGSLTFGGNATTGVNGAGGIAIGANSVSSESAAVAVGSGAGAHGMGSVAIGSNSSATEAGTVSFGAESSSSKIKRRLVNIAPGRDDNDAVAMSQLNALSDKVDGISMAKAPNVTIIGGPTLNNGQASDFSPADYLQFPFILELHDDEAVIDFCFTTGSDVTTQQNLIDSKFGVALAISNGKGLMAISENGISWDTGVAAGTMDIAPNTTYFARLVLNEDRNGGLFKTYLSTDSVNYTEDMILAGTGSPFPTTHYIGGADESIVGHETHPFEGIIDLNKCKMTINGELFWEGMDSLGLRTRADVSLSNLDAAGEEKIRLAASADIVQTTPTIVGKYNGKNVYRYSVSLAGKRVSGSSTTTVGTIPNALDPGNNCTIVAFSGRITSDQGSARYFYPLPYVGAGSGSFMLISPFVDMDESSMTANIQLGIYPSSSSVTGLNGDFLTVDYTLD